MSYRLRDDVVLEKVSGINMLISLRSAWGECPFALQIATVSANVWNYMKAGLSSEEIIEKLMTEDGYSREKAALCLQSFIRSSKALHYLVPEESEC